MIDMLSSPFALRVYSDRHSGAPRRGEPGTHEHRPLEYGFRVCRFAASRNDSKVVVLAQ
jgi:hypothetical protein